MPMLTEKCASHNEFYWCFLYKKQVRSAFLMESDTLLLLQVKDQAIRYSIPNKSSWIATVLLIELDMQEGPSDWIAFIKAIPCLNWVHVSYWEKKWCLAIKTIQTTMISRYHQCERHKWHVGSPQRSMANLEKGHKALHLNSLSVPPTMGTSSRPLYLWILSTGHTAVMYVRGRKPLWWYSVD